MHISLFIHPPLPSSILGVMSLSQALCSSDDYSNSLLHLDLSKNPGILSGEDATVRPAHQHATCTRTRTHRCSACNTRTHSQTHARTHTHARTTLFKGSLSPSISLQNMYLFLAQPNCLVHLDLSGTDCTVDSVSSVSILECFILWPYNSK